MTGPTLSDDQRRQTRAAQALTPRSLLLGITTFVLVLVARRQIRLME